MNFKKVKGVVFDFDGVFTDNTVIVSENGEESVICNRADGIGIEMLKNLQIPIIIISSEINPVVTKRAGKLKIPVKQGVKNKAIELKTFSKFHDINLKNIAYLGNDINDLDCMNKVGFPIAVADAFDEIKKISCYILKKAGGNGAVRELCELINKSNNDV